MDRLQLATLLSWAGHGGFQGRKRLQKVVFFLQNAGCDLDCRFTLHHFGPYSRDVADACDELVAAGLVIENGPASGVVQYSYELKPSTRGLLKEAPDSRMAKFESKGRQLITEDIWDLELGSTILFYYAHCKDWKQALTDACKFKKVGPDLPASQRALALAKRTREPASA